MQHIPTTATAVRKIKLAARQIQRTTALPLHAALDRAAQDAGYENFHQVTTCANHNRPPALRFAIFPRTVLGLTLPTPIEGDFYIGPDVERVTAQLDELLDELGMDLTFDQLPKGALRKLAQECKRLTDDVPLFLDGHAHHLGALCELQRPADGVIAARTAFDAAYRLIPGGFKGTISPRGLNNRPYYRLGDNLAFAYRLMNQMADAQTVATRIEQFKGRAK